MYYGSKIRQCSHKKDKNLSLVLTYGTRDEVKLKYLVIQTQLAKYQMFAFTRGNYESHCHNRNITTCWKREEGRMKRC